ncbi:MAG TPA: menaquinone biosynthesis protein [Terriglobia bacterium]|nr:menaquinone biosynthesis protein [Terriglobia bacterium]
MAKPRISVVQYLNTVPLIWGMLHGEQRGKFDLDFTTPARCADAVRQGRADVGIIPSIEYPRLDRAEIVAGVSIAAKGKVRSVLLLSNTPVEKINTVALDNSSRTSIALVTILLREFYGRDFESFPFAPDPDAMLERADAALVIGDPALTYQGRPATVLDLGEEWRKFTGLPFVFALWVGRAEAKLSRWRGDFTGSRDYGLAQVDEIARQHASRYGLSPEEVKVYLTENIDYTLDEENVKGLDLFYRLAHQYGMIAAESELRFA